MELGAEKREGTQCCRKDDERGENGGEIGGNQKTEMDKTKKTTHSDE